MALTAIMVDRCRTVRRVKTGRKIDGRPQAVEEKSNWIRCRLESFSESERSDEGHWRRRTSTRLMMLRKDTKGVVADVQAQDQLEISSKAYGDGIWQVEGEPELVRKRTAPFFFRVRVARVED